MSPADTVNRDRDAPAPVGVVDPAELSITTDPFDDHGVTYGDQPDTIDDCVGPIGNPVDVTPITGTRRSGRYWTLTHR
jgi:hypothetical protein